jgi:DedD protein
MERRLKERLIGAAVLVMLAVIIIPMILDDGSDLDVSITETNIPERPKDNFSSRIVPLQDSDLTPLIEEPVLEVEVEVEVEAELLVDIQKDEVSPPRQDKVSISEDEKTIITPVLSSATPVAEANTHMGATAWVVQLGSFSSEENARELNEKLRKAGLPSFVEPLKRESKISYRVRVGPELRRSDAQLLLAKMNKEMKLEGIIIRYP